MHGGDRRLVLLLGAAGEVVNDSKSHADRPLEGSSWGTLSLPHHSGKVPLSNGRFSQTAGNQKKTLRRASSNLYSVCWMTSRTWSVRLKTSMGSSAAPGPSVSVGIGSPNSMIHFEGSGSSPSGPSNGKNGVTGT